MREPESPETLLGPAQGRWLEYWFIPAVSTLTLTAGACAVWSALAGSVRGIPILGFGAYALLAAALGLHLTILYRTGRVEGPGRQFEVLLLFAIAACWHISWRLGAGISPETLPVVGTQSGIPSVLFMAILGTLTWGCGFVLGGVCSPLWPTLEKEVSVDWLKASAPELSPREAMEKEAIEAKGRIAQAEVGLGPYASVSLGVSMVLLLVVLMRPEAHMKAPSAFVVWSLIQVASGLVGTASYALAIRRLAWALHRTAVEPRVIWSWLIALTLTVALVMPFSAGIRTVTKHIRLIPSASTDRATTSSMGVGASDATRLGRGTDSDDAKAKAPAAKPKADTKTKEIKAPQAVVTIWNLLVGIMLLGVLTTTVLMGMSLVVLLLLALANFSPGLFGSKGAMGAPGRMGFLKGLLWPLAVVAGVFGSGAREARAAFRRFMSERARAGNTAARLVLGGRISASKQLARIRLTRQLRTGMKTGSPASAIRFHYAQALMRAERRGLNRVPSDTASELAERLASPPEILPEVESLTSAFETARYAKGEPHPSLAAQARDWARTVLHRFRLKRGQGH